MYSTKREIFYFEENLVEHTVKKIGTWNDMVYHLAKSADEFYIRREKREVQEYFFSLISHQNLTCGDGGPLWQEYKKYHYFDSNGRTVDIRIFMKDAFAYVKKNGVPYESYYHTNPRHQRRKVHSGIWLTSNQKSSTMGYIKKMYDEEMTPYLTGKDRFRMNGWGRNYFRESSCCWKDQKKYKKQWMHKVKAKDCTSIRNGFQDF